MGACKCDNLGLVNTGQPNCIPLFGSIRGLILVEKYDSFGIRNSIDVSTNINDLYVSDKINNENPTQRWYPLMGLENSEEAFADNTYEEGSSGIKYFIKKGIKSVSTQIWNVSENYAAKLDGLRCKRFSVYAIDTFGNLIGMFKGGDETLLYPVDIANGSWNVKFQSASESGNTTSKAIITFDYDRYDSDNAEDLRMLYGDNITASFLNIYGLKDVVLTANSTTSTGFTLKAIIPSNGIIGVPVTGLTMADISLKIQPLNTVLAITGFVETAVLGTYNITFASTPSSVIIASAVKSGFSFNTATINTP